jgi:predicted TIM-barrel fold metal-dependent hydrolase
MNPLNVPIIDSHAHIFPDKIASKAVWSIGKYYNIPMSGKGTVSDLLNGGSKIGVKRYIVHSTATKADQVTSVNDYISGEKNAHADFIGFGSLHPDYHAIAEETDRIISLGLRGIKLHPEFQGFNVDDASMMPIYAAAEGRLPILIHMGDANKDSSSPERLLKVLKKYPKLTVIGAHLGGYQKWESACETLAGMNLYFDTSSSLPFLKPETAVNIIRKHGVDKVIFGTDYPMWVPEEELSRFMNLPLTDREKERILWKNCAKLLGISDL